MTLQIVQIAGALLVLTGFLAAQANLLDQRSYRYLLPNAVGEANARELLLTGRTVEADEAQQLGLVSRAFAAEEFDTRVDEIASGIAATAPIPSRYTKVALRDRGHEEFESCLQWEALAQAVTLATADLQEGIGAARQKRAPQFRGA